MNHTKIFVIENGNCAILRDNQGNTVSFESLEDLSRCTGMDFTGAWYIGYEPDIQFFSDSENDSVTADMIPYQPYEDLIASISILNERKSDPGYGLPAADAAIARLNKDLMEEDEKFMVAKQGTFMFQGHNFYSDSETITGLLTILPQLPEDYSEAWKTADKEADGITNVYVTLNKSDITGMAVAYFEYRKSIWKAMDDAKNLKKDEYKLLL